MIGDEYFVRPIRRLTKKDLTMLKKSAHKNTDNPPGQLVWPVSKQELEENVAKQERSLATEIESYKEICRKTNSENGR